MKVTKKDDALINESKTQKIVSEGPKSWEIAALIFGYFAVIKDVPYNLRMFEIKRIVPDFIITFLLRFNSKKDFWYVIFFTFIVFLWWLHIKTRSIISLPAENADPKLASSILARLNRRRYIRTLGFAWIRDFVLKRMKIATYGTFERPVTIWGAEDTKWDSIDRISFVGGGGVEYQYLRSLDYLSVRKHSKGTDVYDVPNLRKPTFEDFKVLIIASDVFWFWYFLHLIKAPFRWCSAISQFLKK